MQVSSKLSLAVLSFLGVSLFSSQSIHAEPDNSISIESESSYTEDDVQRGEKNIILNGQIGPFDPAEGDLEDPFYQYKFDSEDYIGQVPDNYFTISVSVPTQMQFAVLNHPQNVKGQFYCPVYTVINNATRPVYVSVDAVENINASSDMEYIPLYLENPTIGDKRVQIDLNLGMMNTATSIFYNVNLTNLVKTKGSSDSTYLGVIGLKEQANLQFNSTNWERPIEEGYSDNAKVNFNINLTFSLENPMIQTN